MKQLRDVKWDEINLAFLNSSELLKWGLPLFLTKNKMGNTT